MTTWAPISGYEGIYEVSDDGEVRSLDRSYTGKWATYAENNLHEYRALGKKGYGRKLTDRQVVYIRSSKESPRILAAMFGVSDSVICNVRNRKIYREVGGMI